MARARSEQTSASPANGLTTPTIPFQNVRGDGNSGNLAIALERLVQLFQQAEREELYGTVGVEISFQKGQSCIVRRQYNGTDKPSA